MRTQDLPDGRDRATREDARRVADAGASRRRYLHPCGLHVAPGPERITTVLGSCVAVVLWDPARRVGGINHYLLPRQATEAGLAPPCYGDVAMDRLLAEIRWNGADPRRLEARVYGGARLIGTGADAASPGPGRLNVELALDRLRREGIPVLASDVGGAAGRRLLFDTRTGIVRVERLAT